MPWLACHNPEIDWRTGEVQMMRCLEEYGKKWRTGRQMKPGWQRQKEKEEKREEFRRPTIEEEIAIARIIEKKEEDLTKLRMVEEMVPRQFHKYLEMFEKKELERMPMRKAWNHAIDLKEEFVPKKRKTYLLSRVKREKVQEFCEGLVEKGIH